MEYPKPISPGEPIVPERREIYFTPGRPREEPPIELNPNPPQEVPEPAPEIPEPPKELLENIRGGRNGKPPKRPTTFRDFFGGSVPPSYQQAFGGNDAFPSVDQVSQYHSFRNGLKPHQKDRAFGISVRTSGYQLYAIAVKAHHSDTPWQQCCDAAWRFIVSHQVHHFLVDRAVSTLEGALMIAGSGHRHLWECFHRDERPFSALEESACCAYSLRHAPKKSLASTLVHLQPADYDPMSSDGRSIGSAPNDLSHQKAISRLLSQYLEPTTPYRQSGLHGLMQYEDHKKGTKGDLYFRFPDGGFDTIKVRCGN